MPTYVRVDQIDKYIYFLNDAITCATWYGKPRKSQRSSQLLKYNGTFPCVRMKKLFKLPLDKEINKWYYKGR